TVNQVLTAEKYLRKQLPNGRCRFCFGAGDGSLDVIHQCIGKGQTTCEHVEIPTLRSRLWFNGDPRRGVELDFLSVGLRCGDDRIEIQRFLKFGKQKCLSLITNARQVKPVCDARALLSVDMAIRAGGSDHCAYDSQRKFVLALRSLSRVKRSVSRGREKFRL